MMLSVCLCVCLQTMEVMTDQERLVFLYQLIEGVSEASYACHVASLAGLPNEIISRSKEVRAQSRVINHLSIIFFSIILKQGS